MNMNDEEFYIFHQILLISYFLKKRRRKIYKSSLSEEEAKCLLFLGMGNGEKRISECIHFFQKHKSTVRQKLLSLEKERIISLKHCDGDKREKKIMLTNKGKKLFSEILERNKFFKQQVFQNFSESEKRNFVKLLAKIKENIKNYEKETKKK